MARFRSLAPVGTGASAASNHDPLFWRFLMSLFVVFAAQKVPQVTNASFVVAPPSPLSWTKTNPLAGSTTKTMALLLSRKTTPPTGGVVVVGGGGDRRSFLEGTAATVTMSQILLGANVAEAKTEESIHLRPRDQNRVRIALWGFGNQNQLMAKYLWEKRQQQGYKYDVVSVIGHHNNGDDYGLVIGQQETGVKIVSDIDAATELAKTKPNVCIMATRSTLQDIAPSLTICAKAACNVITIAEELLDCQTSSPKLTKEMDLLFKENGVSFTGSGFIDGACCEMTLTLASMMQRIDKVEGFLKYNVDDYGTVLANAHGVGLTAEQFQNFAKKAKAKSYVYNSNEWFVSALGLTLDKTTEVRQPTFASIPLYSNAVGRTIPVGDVTGMQVVATTTTKEGVTIVGKQIGQCYQENVDQDGVKWGFVGEPNNVAFSMEGPPTPQMTNTATIARIPQILTASPGYVLSHQLGRIAARASSS